MPRYVAAWATMDGAERTLFRADWDVVCDQLDRVRGWARQGHLSEAQATGLREIEALVTANAPLIDELLA